VEDLAGAEPDTGAKRHVKACGAAPAS
jgi:hypothetical protein